MDFILSHFDDNTFQRPIFPRKISTLKTNNTQKEVYSKDEALQCYVDSQFGDCRINAFPSHTDYKGIQRYPPNFIFIDLDRSNFKTDRSLELALSNTLKNIKEKIDGHPTVLFTGGGYHIYQPINGVILEGIREFAKYEFMSGGPSTEFLRFGEKFLSNYKADNSHNISFKSCLLRIPNSTNSKYDVKVKIIQKWDGKRPPMQNLLGYFLMFLVNQQIKDKKCKTNIHKGNCCRFANSKINWIEQLLETPIEDYRKNSINLILAPYLANIKKLSDGESLKILENWIQRCDMLRKVNFNEKSTIEYALRYSKRKGQLPMKLVTLKDKNFELYKIISGNIY